MIYKVYTYIDRQINRQIDRQIDRYRYIYMCVCVSVCVSVCVPRVKKSYLEKIQLLFINYFTTCVLPLVVIHLCSSIICRTYAFPKVQLNLISPFHTGLIFSRNDAGVGTIPRLLLSLNLPLAFKNEDSQDFLSSFKHSCHIGRCFLLLLCVMTNNTKLFQSTWEYLTVKTQIILKSVN